MQTLFATNAFCFRVVGESVAVRENVVGGNDDVKENVVEVVGVQENGVEVVGVQENVVEVGQK